MIAETGFDGAGEKCRHSSQKSISSAKNHIEGYMTATLTTVLFNGDWLQV